jgi:uncharacterized membrane protein YbaN (DUF454 family)
VRFVPPQWLRRGLCDEPQSWQKAAMRGLYLFGGFTAIVLGLIGLLLPIMPTVPFLILAAWCFGRSNPAWEQRLLDHPRFGEPIRNWREYGAIGRTAKLAATIAFVASCAMGLALTPWPWPLLPVGIAIVAGGWIWSRPEL